MCIFAILELVSSNLRNARRLQEPHVDAGSLIAELSLTNKLYEGAESGISAICIRTTDGSVKSNRCAPTDFFRWTFLSIARGRLA